MLKVSVFPDKMFYIPCTVGDSTYHALAASVCSFATAINYPIEPHPEIRIESDFDVPLQFADIVEKYNRLQSYTEVHFVRTSEVSKYVDYIEESWPIVNLFSGGKDSMAKLLSILSQYEKRDIACMYVRGTTINAEFVDEYKVVRQICNNLGVQLLDPIVYHADYGDYSLKVRLRAIWRNMLLIVMARGYSSRISIGDNYDPTFCTDFSALEAYPGSFMNFSATKIVQDSLAQILRAEIEIGSSEIENTRFLMRHHPEILKAIRSCFNPIQPCDAERNWSNACRKCKTNHIYVKLAENVPLSEPELEFVRSKEWLGDPQERKRFL